MRTRTVARSWSVLIASTVAVAACSLAPDTAKNPDAVIVVAGRTVAAHRKPAAPIPFATVAPLPQPHPTATAIRMVPHKSFVDPPLPPELRDDGGLIPLPPPPTANQATTR